MRSQLLPGSSCCFCRHLDRQHVPSRAPVAPCSRRFFGFSRLNAFTDGDKQPHVPGSQHGKLSPKHSTLKPVQAGASLVSSERGVDRAISVPDYLRGRFKIPADEVQELLTANGLEAVELLRLLIQPASLIARPPISNFYVGTAALAGSGAIYIGGNLEFKGLPLNNSVHSEQCLLVNLIHHDEHEVQIMAVTVAPCGHCRQFFSELACAERVRFIFGKDLTKLYSLSDLLPARFGPVDLLPDPNAPLLLQPQNNPVELTQASHEWVSELPPSSGLRQATQAALLEARSCYSPYTHCFAGVALLLEDGRIFGGGCLESAAYNPTLNPLQAAVVELVVHGVESYGQVRDAVLVEVAGAPVSYADSTQLLMRHIMPHATLHVVHAQRTAGKS